jgi:methylmalonyl-CoA mutase N-terminal domain/subunit
MIPDLCYTTAVSEDRKKPSKQRKVKFATDADIAIKGEYKPADAPATPPAGAGEFPFTRGVQETMYRGQLWTMRQYAGFGSAAESNQRYKYLLAQGGKGLSVAFDLPTQMGRDSDHPMARGEVGRVGVAIDSLEDMRVLFDGIPLADVSTSMTINATAATLLALYIAVGEEQGTPARALRGTIQNDILKEYIARGTYIYPPAGSMRLITDTFTYCSREVPQWNTVSISGYHIREAGSDAVQEVAFTLADGVAYVEAALAAGLDVDDFAPRLSFFFNVHNNFIEEVAKFRAARTLWAWIMKDRFKAKNPKSQMLRFHSQTAGVTLQAQQPLVNIVRVTLQALAAVVGGSPSTRTRTTRRSACRPRRPRGSRCEPSRSSLTSPASRTSSTRWVARMPSRPSPRRSRPGSASTSRRSTSSAAWSARSSSGSRSARSSAAPTSTSVPSSARSGSLSASTST